MAKMFTVEIQKTDYDDKLITVRLVANTIRQAFDKAETQMKRRYYSHSRIKSILESADNIVIAAR